MEEEKRISDIVFRIFIIIALIIGFMFGWFFCGMYPKEKIVYKDKPLDTIRVYYYRDFEFNKKDSTIEFCWCTSDLNHCTTIEMSIDSYMKNKWYPSNDTIIEIRK